MIRLLYIDPATTSYIIQIAAGVLLALGTVVGIFWNKIKRLFKKNKDDDKAVKAVQHNKAEGEKITIKAEDLLDDEDKD